MTGYTKLFGSIIGSTIWSEDNNTRIVWITMLALANRYGEIKISIPGLAGFAKVPIENVEQALTKFTSPDKYSSTKDFDGRRVEEIDGGSFLLNYKKYRDMASADDRREQTRIRAERFRQNHTEKVTQLVTHSNAEQRTVTENNDKQKQKQKQMEIKNTESASPVLLSVEALALEIYELYPRKVGKPKAIASILKQLKKHSAEKLKAATQQFAKAWTTATMEEKTFCPHPTTWFNQERFNDSPETWQRKVNTSTAKSENGNILSRDQLLKQMTADAL